jgi:hypothetical protein
MSKCPLCGGKISEKHWSICENCYGPEAMGHFGDEEHGLIHWALHNLHNTQRTDEEDKMIADSVAFVKLVETCLPLVEEKCFVNLLAKVTRNL